MIRAIVLLLFVMLIYGCSQKAEKETVRIIRDTIIIRDSFPFWQTIFVKNSKEKDAILPVDTILEECLTTKSQSTTLGMIDCFDKSSEILLIKIKRKEDNLLAFFDPKHDSLLIESQKNWRKFLETESTFLYKTYYTWANYSNYPSLGREASIDQANWKYLIIRDRLVALENYYDRVYYEKE